MCENIFSSDSIRIFKTELKLILYATFHRNNIVVHDGVPIIDLKKLFLFLSIKYVSPFLAQLIPIKEHREMEIKINNEINQLQNIIQMA